MDFLCGPTDLLVSATPYSLPRAGRPQRGVSVSFDRDSDDRPKYPDASSTRAFLTKRYRKNVFGYLESAGIDTLARKSIRQGEGQPRRWPSFPGMNYEV